MAKRVSAKKNEDGRYLTERAVDELGRMVLPIEQRQFLGIGIKTKCTVEVTEDGKGILIRRMHNACSLCHHERENLIPVADGFVCEECAALVRDDTSLLKDSCGAL